MKRFQSGFTLVELVFVIVWLAAFGAGCYIVWLLIQLLQKLIAL